MAIKKSEVEAMLVGIELHDGVVTDKISRHLLGATLRWPRIGIASKNYPVSVQLKQGKWQQHDHSWSDSILFKETLQGRFGFEVTLTSKLTDAVADEFMRNMASQFVKLTVAADKLAPPLFDSLVGLPFGYLVKTILKEKAPPLIASGLIDLDSTQLPATGQSVRWAVPLHAPENIKRVIRKKVGKTTRQQSELLFAAGSEVGCCHLDVRVL